jgi:hypothetical protein
MSGHDETARETARLAARSADHWLRATRLIGWRRRLFLLSIGWPFPTIADHNPPTRSEINAGHDTSEQR